MARPALPGISTRLRPGGVLAIAAGHAVHDTYTGFLPPLLPLLVPALGLVKAEAGLLAVLLQLPWLLQPAIGHLADRARARAMVVAAPAVSAVAMSLLGVAPSYAALVPLLLLAGLASAALHAVGPALVGTLSGGRLGRGMGIWMVGGELGRTLGPVVAVAAVAALSLRGLPWVMVGGLAASFLLHRVLGPATVEPPDAQAAALPWRRLLRGLLPLLLPLAGIMLLRAFLVAALNLYLPLFLTEEGADLWLAGIALTVLEAAGVGGALLGGALSDRIGRRTMLAVSLLVASPAMWLFLAADGWLRLPLLVLLGLSALSVTPVIMAMVQEAFPGNRALANGTYMLTNFVLRSLAVLGLGAWADRSGLGAAYGWSAALALGGLLLLPLLPARPARGG